jgi:hypothetical protein
MAASSESDNESMVDLFFTSRGKDFQSLHGRLQLPTRVNAVSLRSLPLDAEARIG